MNNSINFFVVSILFLLNGCGKESNSEEIKFGTPQRVTVTGYDGHIMEPFLSRDGTILLFNNLNQPIENTNLHWATRVDDTHFDYEGEVQNTNTEYLEGVPTMDSNGVLYFVSVRSYDQTFSSIYKTTFSSGITTDPILVDGISKNLAGWVNFDVEVDPSGTYLYFVDGTFDQFGGPYTADIVIAKKNGDLFERLANSSELLKNINTDELEYAACVSANSLELYFTRVPIPINASSSPKIFVALRSSISEPFKNPVQLNTLTGFVEGPTISPDGSLLYYHKSENDKFVLYAAHRL